MDKKQLPILVFDSGAGGISVLRELVKIMPEEDFVFFGDSANAPYGTKSVEQIQDLTISTVAKYRTAGAKACAIACNTATSAAAATLRAELPLPIVGMEPALKPASQLPGSGTVVGATTPGAKAVVDQSSVPAAAPSAATPAMPPSAAYRYWRTPWNSASASEACD